MSAEFSLLQHLGVSVDKCEPASTVQSNSAAKATPRDAFRVWAPAQHPPPNKKVSSDQVRGVLDRRRRGVAKSYADPTGEVLLRNEHGTEVQYVVYNSRVPSVYGVNKQLAERKQAEKAREGAEQHRSGTTTSSYALALGQNEAEQERARKHILRELQLCNQEQANRKKEEERRDRERRIAQERAQLRYRDAEAARADEEARLHKAHQEEALRKAAAEAAAAKKHITAAAKAAVDKGSYAAWNGAEEDERRRRASQRRTREFAEANQRLAEQQRAERGARAIAERERVRAELAEVEQQMQREQLQVAAKQRKAAEALRHAQESEREKRLAVSAAGVRVSTAPMGSLFDLAEQRESDAVQQAQQRLREDMAINARLAEAKRTQAKEERERERQYAAQMAEASFEEFQREIAQSRLRRLQEQKQLKTAAEAAAARAREKQQQEMLQSRSRPDDPMLFWAREDAARADEIKIESQRRYHEEVRRQAERKQAERMREEKEEKARERALVEYDQEVAKAEALRERKEMEERTTQLRRALEEQIAMKKQQQEQERLGSSHWEPLRVPAPDVVPLYRCPITSELLPASAYDFGVQRHR
jgi:hypothetical protein